jgi:Rieske Fe-S protein
MIFRKSLVFAKLVLVLFFLLCVFSCQKQKQQVVPYVYVDIRMYSSDPSFISLNSPGGWAYVSGGNHGILVYRRSLNEFAAYDRTCTYTPNDPNETVSVEAANNILAADAHCGSKFLITDGSVNRGPATLPLKAYQTTYDGTVLHIFN